VAIFFFFPLFCFSLVLVLLWVTLDGFNLVALWVSLLSHSHSLVEHGIPFRWELAAELFSPWREKEREREREDKGGGQA
jgi:hypothetical protein